MLLRTLALATILLFGSTAASVSASDHSSDPKAFEIQKAKDKDKDKDKNKQSAPVSVPDGDPSTGLLLIIALAVPPSLLSPVRDGSRESTQKADY